MVSTIQIRPVLRVEAVEQPGKPGVTVLFRIVAENPIQVRSEE